ncbi:hypothetical protein E2F48_10800 [Arthrobacter crusticola]|uniref:Putative Flp pilus-assembly TadG-like N-terminal domain-containing protein n=1 Tax=Arthrobacter crusticola TaxID=2547960 RepID=A0A4V3AM63_9MICC|nr:pilus assembly protein TadG-related protein [Arthrobacter crusticola]TDK25719.1 hypothetical protein E2F48_10800 [Arthrobacter crusticola]
MRRITKFSSSVRGSGLSIDSEGGAVSILVAVLLIALLGVAALAVDVGAVYWEKAQLQSGADAAALAIAGDCAAGTPGACDDGNTAATGQFFADRNANDDSTGVTSAVDPTAGRVRIETNARDAGTGENRFSLFFARALGIESTLVTASAEAVWGAPSGGTTLPWTISQCVFQRSLSPAQLAQFNSTGNFEGDPTPTHILLRYNNTADFPGCGRENGDIPGGFGWLDMDGTGCSARVNIGTREAGSDPGVSFPRARCEATLSTIMGEPVLIPIYTNSTLSGSRATYTLGGFAAFQITGYKFSGGSDLRVIDPLAPPCEGGACRGIQGFFTRFVSLEEGMTVTPGGQNYGTSIVSLSR